MIVPLHTCVLVFRSQETPIDGQPPALPPKQFKRNSWNQIHHSHSQQELDNHINETFDVPASPEKSTVSFFDPVEPFCFLSELWSYFTWAWFWSISELLCLGITLQHFCYPYCPFTGSCWFYFSCWSSALSVDKKNHYIGMVLQTFCALSFQHMQKFLPNLLFEKSFAINFKEDIADV